MSQGIPGCFYGGNWPRLQTALPSLANQGFIPLGDKPRFYPAWQPVVLTKDDEAGCTCPVSQGSPTCIQSLCRLKRPFLHAAYKKPRRSGVSCYLQRGIISPLLWQLLEPSLQMLFSSRRYQGRRLCRLLRFSFPARSFRRSSRFADWPFVFR